jgi:hypothetical protein
LCADIAGLVVRRYGGGMLLASGRHRLEPGRVLGGGEVYRRHVSSARGATPPSRCVGNHPHATDGERVHLTQVWRRLDGDGSEYCAANALRRYRRQGAAFYCEVVSNDDSQRSTELRERAERAEASLANTIEERNELWSQALRTRAVEHELSELRTLVRRMEQSVSWRLTSPLRRAKTTTRRATAVARGFRNRLRTR